MEKATVTPYYENVVNGEVEEYTDQKRLVKTTKYQFNRQSGPVITYYLNGKKQTETNYMNAQKSGRFYEYFENGEVKIKGNHLYNVRQALGNTLMPMGKSPKLRPILGVPLMVSTEN